MPETPADEQALNDNQRALELNARARTPELIRAPQGSASTLEQVLTDPQANWQISTSGAGGALLVSSDQLTSGGVAVKIESHVAGKAGAVLSGAMNGFLKEAQGPAPFVAPRLTHLTSDSGLSGELTQSLQQKVQGLEQGAPENRRYLLNRLQDKLNQVEQGSEGVAVMELAPGTQLNKLSPEEKLALLKSEAFAQQLGRAMPLASAIGLDDHLTAKTEDTLCKNNPSNLMYDPHSGNLSLIDFSTSGVRISNDSEALRYTNKGDAGGDIKALQNFITRATAGEEPFNQTLDRLAVADSNNDMILGNFMANYVNGTHGDSMFPQDQYATAIDSEKTPVRPDEATLEMLKASDAANKAAQARLTPEDKKRFAANVMKGTVEGLAYLKDNQPALRTGIKGVHEGEGEQAVQHLLTDPQLDKLCTELDKLNIDSLRQGVDARLDALDRAPAEKLAALKQSAETDTARIQELEARVDKLSHKAGSRLRSIFPGHGGALNQARDELAALKTQRNTTLKEMHQAMNDVAFTDHLRAQRIQDAEQNQAPRLNRQPSVAERLGRQEDRAEPRLNQADQAHDVRHPGSLEPLPSVRSGDVGGLIRQFESKPQSVGRQANLNRPDLNPKPSNPGVKQGGGGHHN